MSRYPLLDRVEMSEYERCLAEASLRRGEAIADAFLSLRNVMWRMVHSVRSHLDGNVSTGLVQPKHDGTDRVRDSRVAAHQMLDDSAASGFGM